jgi:hypothetical protein
MSENSELLEFFQKQQEETMLQRFLEKKGYSSPCRSDFGLNHWTNRLVLKRSSLNVEIQGKEEQADHFVSFLSVPDCWQEECLDTNAEDLKLWFSGYKWEKIPGMNYPPIQGRIQACSEGLILPQWLESSGKEGVEAFLLIRRDGICEYGIGKNAYYLFEGNTIFQFINIVGRLWQFLVFINDLQRSYLKDQNPGVKIIVNLRGTKDAYLGNLAEKWNEPYPSHSFDGFRPRCIDDHLQIQKTLSPGVTENDIPEIVRWFATRIDNAWGQFEPRCYVSKQFDETAPFALLTRK